MRRNTWIAIGAMVVIGVLAVITLREPPKGERVGPRPRPMAAFTAEAVSTLELTNGETKTTVALKRDDADKGWSMTAPAPFRADQQLAKAAVEQLAKITWGDVVSVRKEKHADLGVSDDKGIHVVAKDASGKALFDGWLGKSVSGFTMARPAGSFAKGEGEVWQASGIQRYAYAKDAKSWRDHAMLSFERGDVEKLAVSAGGQSIELEKLPPEGNTDGKKDDKDSGKPKPPIAAKWKVTQSTVTVSPLDEDMPNQIVAALSSLSCADFDDQAKPADVGLAPPRYRVTVTVKGAPTTLLIGQQKGDDVWAQLEGKPPIYLLRKYAIERIAVKPMDFRDKTLTALQEADLASIEVAQGGEKLRLDHEGGAWKAGAGFPGALDESKAKGVAGAFERLVGSSFVEGADAKTTGLAKPAAEVKLSPRAGNGSLGAPIELKVGAVDGASNAYYVQKVGSPDVLLVKKYLVDRFLKKPADLVKK